MLRDLFLIVFSLILPMKVGVTGIFWAAPTADIIAILITAAVMVRLWKQLSSQEAVSSEPDAPILQPSQAGVILTISREHGSAASALGSLWPSGWASPVTIKR